MFLSFYELDIQGSLVSFMLVGVIEGVFLLEDGELLVLGLELDVFDASDNSMANWALDGSFNWILVVLYVCFDIYIAVQSKERRILAWILGFQIRCWIIILCLLLFCVLASIRIQNFACILKIFSFQFHLSGLQEALILWCCLFLWRFCQLRILRFCSASRMKDFSS